MSLSYQGTSPEVSRNQSITSIASIGFFTFQSRVKMFSFVESQCSPMRLPGQRPSLPFETTSLPPCFFFLSPCNADGPTTQRGKIKGCKQRAKCFPLSLFYSCTVPLLHRQRVFENTDSNNWHRRGGYVDSPVAQMEKNFRLRLRRLTLRHEAPVLA